MKTKNKKENELKKAEELISKSEGLIFIDISKIPTKFINKLRQELKNNLNQLLVIKKRLFNIGLKNKKIHIDLSNIKNSFGVIFVNNIESGISQVYKFLKNLEKEKIFDSTSEKIFFGFNIKQQKELNKQEVIQIGTLPSREVALGQLLGMISTPLRSLMYILQEKAKRS
ncbi:MAG: 50S ribosomal protein L10 [Patescibacteria group bacterium]|nr:50S ribosomal protein L10 [Patescibacteria group bacterium]MDW8279760.1 50S ribosomal protein L10 [bacterium]